MSRLFLYIIMLLLLCPFYFVKNNMVIATATFSTESPPPVSSSDEMCISAAQDRSDKCKNLTDIADRHNANNETFVDEFVCGFGITGDVTNETIINNHLNTVSSSLSLIGSVYIILTFVVLPDMRVPLNMAVLQLSVVNLVGTVGSLLPSDVPLYDPLTCCLSTICYAQAIFAEFDVASIFWSMSITLQAYFLTVLGFSTKAMNGIYKFFSIFSWSIPAILTVWGVIGNYYGPAGNTCWIPSSDANTWKQIVFYHMWLVLSILIIAGALTHMSFAVRGTKASGITTRYMFYAGWSVFTTFGFFVSRSISWANTEVCNLSEGVENALSGLGHWNAFVYPLQGFGYAIIFSFNGNVTRGWKRLFAAKQFSVFTDTDDVEMTTKTDMNDTDASYSSDDESI